MKRNYRVLLIGASLGIAFLTASLSAKAQTPKYKEGDRVEVDIVHVDVDHGGNPALQRWKKGVVLQADTGTAKRYVIQLDPIPGQAPVIHTIPMYDENCCIRPFGGAAPKILTDKLRVDENGTVLADRELLDCDNLKHSGRNGSPPPPDLIRKLIRCLFEKPSPAGQDGATTMDITDFTIGGPHRWVTGIDSGQGTANTLVYPVHVKWNTKKFLHDRNDQVTDAEGTFTCFADAVNLWQCGFATGPHKDGKKQEIVVKP
jgi:hypothetical protein